MKTTLAATDEGAVALAMPLIQHKACGDDSSGGVLCEKRLA
ncbi:MULTISPECIES: hypothetical protein [unclassified Caballeronia]